MNSIDLGLKRLTVFFLCLNIFTIALIPTGAFPSFKALVLISVFGLMFVAVASRVVVIRVSWQKLLGALLFPLLIFAAVGMAFFHGIEVDGILLEAKSLVTIYLLVILYYLVVREKLVAYELLLTWVLIGHVLYICMKIFVLFYFFSQGSKETAVMFLSSISSNIVVAGKLGIGGAYRVVSAIDLISPFLFFIVLIVDVKVKGLIKKLMLIILFINVIVSLSRYGMVSFFILGFLYCLCMRKMILFLVLSLLTVSAVVIAADFSNINLYGAIEHRFNGEGKLSTAVKFEQSYYLLREVSEYPFLGKGLGSYVEEYLRSENPKYGYEAFWLALWMQLGSVGMLFFLLYLCIPLFLALKKFHRHNVIMFFTYILFLGGGMTNPTVIGVSASVMYVLMFVFHLQFQKTTNMTARL